MALIAKVPNSFTLLFIVFLFFVTPSKDKRIILAFSKSIYSDKRTKVGA